MKKLLTTLILAFVCCISSAQESEYTPFFVSAILKLNGSDGTLKIVQGMVVSDSPSNAQIVFTVMATKQFPQYTIVDVLPSSFSQLLKTLPTGKQPVPPVQQKDEGKAPT